MNTQTQSFFERYNTAIKEDLSRFILRFTTGILMIFHGMHKLLNGHDYIRSLLNDHGLPEYLWYFVPVAEVLAPILLILGVFTRISALAITSVMTVAIYLFHGSEAFQLSEWGGIKSELNLYFLLVAFAIFLIGPGKIVVYNFKNKFLV